MDLSLWAAGASFLSAACWLYSAQTISPEKEVKYRRKEVAAGRLTDEGATLEIMDGENTYELIATLRHQGRWSRNGAFCAALAFAIQAVDSYI